ncbi:MAG: thiamine diphosphokinase [Oscillospiraceae bacterium]|nr:thiamine diphosphokinase [Oscillospiraceae bacterium]
MGIVKSRCVIIGGGDCSSEFLKNNIQSGDCVICADSGYDYALKAGIAPDVLIGDFDSVKSVPVCSDKITLPVEKDITDSEAAFLEGIKREFKSFLLLGGTGGRFEHTFANISIMAKAVKCGFDFIIADERHIFRCIHNSSLKIPYSPNVQISVFAFGGKALGVTEKGFHYPLSEYTLDPFEPLGISNDVTAEYGEISVEDGTLIIIETKM